MSISSALLAGVTGLASNSSRLAAISDNIANANTVGYKRVGIDFTSLVNAGSRSAYSAGGVSTATRQYVDQQGTLQSSASATDLAISGQGFFVTSNKSQGLTAGDPRFFTRAGSFAVDQNGFLQNAAGLYLMGWNADSAGVVTPNSTMASIAPINILSVNGTAVPTSNGSITANLNSDQTVRATDNTTYAADLAAGPPAVYDMSLYASGDTTNGIKPDFSITMPVIDSKGGQRNIVVDLLKSSTPNQWYAEVRADPTSDVDVGAGETPGLIASGIIAFKPDGTLDTSATTTLPASITLGASSGTAPTAPAVQWANGLGLDAQTISLSIDKMTQFSGPSDVASVKTDGSGLGSLSGVSIDNAGKVTAVYDNGTTREIAQLAVATFANPDGLKSVNGDAYQASLQSGDFNLKQAGLGGAGAISPSSLEASTVDLSSEFTGLIVTQRAYSASSKIITTADQMLEELLSIKR